MVFEHLSRNERRLAVKHARELQKNRPAWMTPLEETQWPKEWKLEGRPPIQAWQSRKFHAQLYPEGKQLGHDCLRLSIGRCTLETSGRWEGDISWDDLMRVKHECGFSDWYGLEVYPRQADIVDVANLRHLWLFGQPLELGWFEGVRR